MSRTETGVAEVVYEDERVSPEGFPVSELLGTLAHELRNPLASLQGCAQTMVERGDDLPPEVRKRMSAVIAKHAERMDWLIRAVASFGDGGVPGEDRVDLGDLLRTVGEECGAPVDAEAGIVIRGNEQRLRLALEAVFRALGPAGTARLLPDAVAVELAAPAVDPYASGRRWKLEAAARLLGVDGATLEIEHERDRRAVVRLVFLPGGDR